MEIDTGAARSIISKSLFDNLWPTNKPVLSPPRTILKTYGGLEMKVEGEFEVTVTTTNSKSISQKLSLLVVSGEGPALVGRDWITALKIPIISNCVNTISSTKTIVDKFPDLFSPGLGLFRDHEGAIIINPDATPKYCKARPIPYAMKAKVDAEIDRLLDENTIEPVPYSEWAAPVVPVLKPDGTIRLCGDYKLTANTAIKLDSYPIPKVEDLFSNLAGGIIFSKLDMSQAYAQLRLSEASRAITTINTH